MPMNDTAPLFQKKLDRQGPRRLLALDGGGIRGVITLEVLAEIECQLQQHFSRGDDFVLADFFDYIAGTSTGAIIGTFLALGMRVAEVSRFYEESGPAMFDKAGLVERFRRGKFRDEKLAERLREVIGEKTGDPLATLSTPRLRTLLMIVLRNATTDSPWLVSNNPSAKYNALTRGTATCTSRSGNSFAVALRRPLTFPPETVSIGGSEFIFVDGGVTMYNNPAFQLFLMATVEAYNLSWPAGEKEMLLVSIGTGTDRKGERQPRSREMNLIYNASSIPSALMLAASNEQDFLCRVFGQMPRGRSARPRDRRHDRAAT